MREGTYAPGFRWTIWYGSPERVIGVYEVPETDPEATDYDTACERADEHKRNKTWPKQRCFRSS